MVFDGAAVAARGGQVWARGVRVLFSAAGAHTVASAVLVERLVRRSPAG